MTTTDRSIIESYKVGHYIKFNDAGTPAYVKCTEVNTAETEREAAEYSPEWIDYEVQPTYSTGSKDTITLEISLLGPGGIQKELYLREDDRNIPVEYVRTLAYDFEKGAPCPANALTAKHAHGVLNVQPLTTEASSAAVITATLSVTTSYDRGTFDPGALAFAPAGGGGDGAGGSTGGRPGSGDGGGQPDAGGDTE